MCMVLESVLVSFFYRWLTFINGQIIQKINKETQALNDTLEQIILIDVYRALHSKVAEITFFSSACGTSRIDHMLGHKVSFGKLKKKLISSIFSEQNAMKLEITYK